MGVSPVDKDDLGRFWCLNPDCPDHAKRGHDNLGVTARYGSRRTCMPRCRTCQTRFSERTGTPLFGTRLAPDTVIRTVRAAGDHARQLHDELVAFSPDD